MRLIADQADTIERLERRVSEQDAEIAELKRRLGQNSSNPSRPPASDSPFRKPAPRSQRRAVGRKPGAQPGHGGANLEQVTDPDEIVEQPRACTGCGSDLDASRSPEGFAWAQVFDLPEPRLIVTEHRMLKVPATAGT